jgi:hypothetical protein
MGCGCGGRRKQAVTSVNEAELALQRQEEQNVLQQQMASLRAAVHNAQSEVVVASAGEIS